MRTHSFHSVLAAMIKMITRTQLLNLFAIFLAFHYVGLGFCDDGAIQCIESERAALLEFKDGFNISANHFLSWTADDNCCKWRGVGCDNRTDHVIALVLRGTTTSDVLRGELRGHSLAKLPFLSYLDLSHNDFGQIEIPDFIGSLYNLEYLNLSNAYFKGTIPENLGNISRLKYLDSSGRNNSLRANSLDWISHLSLLKVLDLSAVDLSNAKSWLHEINMLHSLVELHLPGCQLHTSHPSLPYLNFTALEFPDLSRNYFDSEIPEWLFQLSHSLAHLNLGVNQFIGGIPNDLGNMTSLTFLDHSGNSLTGAIPAVWALDQRDNLGNPSLRELYLSDNQLNGSLEKCLAQLSGLIVLDVSRNSLGGVITEVHLQSFSSLRILDLSFNYITLKVNSNWTPPFQLDFINLERVSMGPGFPKWLQNQKDLSFIDIAKAGISDTVPDWFWNISPKMEFLALFDNNLRGKIPDLSHMNALQKVYLHGNKFTGGIPYLPPKIMELDLSDNMLSGSASSLCHIMSVNNAPLSYLYLSRNNVTGPLPDCWQNWTSLTVISLYDNSLSGTIPTSIGFLRHLRLLNPCGNNLHGELPLSLSNCTELNFLCLSNNNFSGIIPAWIGETLLKLNRLFLNGNQFYGKLPWQLWNLKFIWQLDLSSNNLSGTLTPEITGLAELNDLKISSNRISGAIPNAIGALTYLKYLDLSNNELSCSIPTSMIDLHYLRVLNVSYNKLSGLIPRGKIFDTFNSSSYKGNSNLSGRPLEKECPRNESYDELHCKWEAEEQKEESEEENTDWLDVDSLYISLPLGFVVGFWCVWGPLFIRQSWRHAYSRFLERIADKIYVTVAVGVARFQRKFQSQEMEQ